MYVIDIIITRNCSQLKCFKPSTLSQKSATVAENGETTAKFGGCRTFLRQCASVDRLLLYQKREKDEEQRKI